MAVRSTASLPLGYDRAMTVLAGIGGTATARALLHRAGAFVACLRICHKAA
jgi:hypothetical protein